MTSFVGKISLLRSSSGRRYLGIKDIPTNKLLKYQIALRSTIGNSDYLLAAANQLRRDKGVYHITLTNPQEYESLTALKLVTDSIGKDARVDLNGIGKRTTTPGNSTFYIIANSRDLDEIRQSFGLKKREFHVTLGFLKNDIHGVSKGNSSQFISEQTVRLTPIVKSKQLSKAVG
jgi:hypothetical protein